jgi:hypothetical protein
MRSEADPEMLHAQALEMTLRLRRQIFGKCRKRMLQWSLAFLTKRRQVRVFPGQERTAEAP